MRIAPVIVILLLLCGVGICAESQPPPPTPLKGINKPQHPTQSDQPKTQDDKRGTEDFPLVVKTFETQSDASEKNRAAEHREKEALNSKWTMRFTGGAMCVALFQLGFFYWQLGLMRKSVKDTEIAAKAAELNARAAIGIELPVIRAVTSDLVHTGERPKEDGIYGGFVNNGPPTKFSTIGRICFKNHGRTPAFPEKLSVGWMVTDILPETPKYIKSITISNASVIKPENEFTPDAHYSIELTDEEISLTKENKAWLWFYGCLYYTDFMNTKREARFCWRFASQYSRFCFSNEGNPPAEYTRNT